MLKHPISQGSGDNVRRILKDSIKDIGNRAEEGKIKISRAQEMLWMVFEYYPELLLDALDLVEKNEIFVSVLPKRDAALEKKWQLLKRGSVDLEKLVSVLGNGLSPENGAVGSLVTRAVYLTDFEGYNPEKTAEAYRMCFLAFTNLDGEIGTPRDLANCKRATRLPIPFSHGSIWVKSSFHGPPGGMYDIAKAFPFGSWSVNALVDNNRILSEHEVTTWDGKKINFPYLYGVLEDKSGLSFLLMRQARGKSVEYELRHPLTPRSVKRRRIKDLLSMGVAIGVVLKKNKKAEDIRDYCAGSFKTPHGGKEWETGPLGLAAITYFHDFEKCGYSNDLSGDAQSAFQSEFVGYLHQFDQQARTFPPSLSLIFNDRNPGNVLLRVGSGIPSSERYLCIDVEHRALVMFPDETWRPFFNADYGYSLTKDYDELKRFFDFTLVVLAYHHAEQGNQESIRTLASQWNVDANKSQYAKFSDGLDQLYPGELRGRVWDYSLANLVKICLEAQRYRMGNIARSRQKMTGIREQNPEICELADHIEDRQLRSMFDTRYHGGRLKPAVRKAWQKYLAYRIFLSEFNDEMQFFSRIGKETLEKMRCPFANQLETNYFMPLIFQ